MRKFTIVVCLLVICATTTSAQQPGNSIHGILYDTLARQPLFRAVVSVLQAKDSMLVKFARTDARGHFTLKDLPAGKYILLGTMSDYADYIDTLTIAGASTLELGTLPMITKAHLLQEVVVKQTISAIRFKGDTTEYRADSFKVQANASVEELLKMLPGIQVDKSGQITAQGKKVQKVLVDGEEFFGDDPTLVTQNIRADMVDKVQVFDKKSDQAAFTGVDDGKKTTTINFKLKDDKKRGYFGRADASAGTDGYYNEQLMFNKFQRKEKLAFYGILSNTGKVGLNWQEQNSYGDNSAAIMVDENNNITGRDDLTDWGGSYSGKGLPKVQTGGVHYNNKWGDDKQAINGNFKSLDLTVNGTSAVRSQYILPDTSYYNNQQQVFTNRIQRNKGNLVYDIDFDSTSTLKVILEAGGDHKTTLTQFNTESLSQNSTLVNQGSRTLSTTGDVNTFNSGFLWRKKLAKKGRTFSVDVKENYNDNVSNGFLLANNQFYIGGQQAGSEVTDQYKIIRSHSMVFYGRAAYTEPLSKVSTLILNYGITTSKNSSDRSSFNKSAAGKYESFDSVYSNNYTFDVFTHSAGANYALTLKKLRLNAGNSVGFSSYSQTDNSIQRSTQRNFVNWFPQAYLSYAFTQQRRFNMNYSGATVQPTLQQLQPLRTNEDPLNVLIGNATLKPSFRNNFQLYYSDYKSLSRTSTSIGFNYSTVENAFANSESVDSIGRKISQSINVNGNRFLSAFLGYGFELFGAHMWTNSNFSDSRFVNVVNGRENTTNSRVYSLTLSAGKTVEKLYANSISGNVSYTTSRSSIQRNSDLHYWTYDIHPDFDFYLPWKMQIHADCDFIFRQKTSVFDNNNNIVLMNAWFGKKMLAGDALVIRCSVNDLFNQNIGFNRTVTSNFISENTYSNIRRYFLLSAVWNFNKGPKQ